MNEVDTDVLVVGAGPVGLFLANECARRGLRYRLVESRSTQSEYSKALAIFPRTMEIFDMAGVVEPFLDVANRVTGVSISTHKAKLAHMPFVPQETVYPFIAMVPQDVTEKLLLGELRRKQGDVEYQTTFVAAEQRENDVDVALERNGEKIHLIARFVVGCDGAHSAVRHALNFPFEGGTYEESFLLADIETNEALPADELQLCPSELGPVAIFPMSATRRRVVATIDKPEGDTPSLELVRRILEQRAPAAIEARSMRWSSYFRIHHRHVERLREGCIFIAGDAAHIHSPFGGQGMNTGLHDAWNLVWKLDMAVRVHANEQLLDSYSSERIPVIKGVIETTHLLTKAMATPNKFAQAIRDTVIPMVSRLAPFQQAFVERMSELGIAYKGSPIVEGPGKRFFDESIRGGKGVTNRFLLFVNDGSEQLTQESLRRLADEFCDVAELRLSRHPGLSLVRPDGYIAYESHSSDVRSVSKTVRSLLLRQTARVSVPA